ncbi:hypothetical protein ANO11243_027540 [Dothideomycetidae sp. 11243]|nr:hypothetical protein ANO11243_027540 [fungal sp. No.11243]
MSSNRNLYLAASVACLTAALFGYSVGFIGGILVLPSFLHHFGLDSLDPDGLASATSGTVSIWLLGALLGVPAGMPVCSRLGRRACLNLSAVMYCIGVAMQLVDIQSLLLFDAGRFVNGLGVGAGTLASPMTNSIAEISTPEARGMLLSGYQTVLQLGALLGFWAAFAAHALFPDSSSVQWQLPVAVQLVPGVCLLLGTLCIPESPALLASHRRWDAAHDALAWLRVLPKTDALVQGELEKLQQASVVANVAQKKRSGFWSEIRKPDLRKRLAVGIGLMIGQNMMGLNALNYYAPKVFMSAGFTSVSASLFLTGIFGLIKLVSALAFMFVFVGSKGNRFWLRLGSAVCGVAMVVLAVCKSLRFETTDVASSAINPYGMVAILMVYVFAFFFGLSLGPLSWNICSEIFPTSVKAECCAITTCTQWLFQIVIAGITPYLLSRVGWGMYLVYAVCCVLTFVGVQFGVPETQGVPLGAEMDKLFGVETSVEHSPEVIEEVSETTALLGQGRSERIRRGSIGYV